MPSGYTVNMRIGPSIPFHAARAYGIGAGQPASVEGDAGSSRSVSSENAASAPLPEKISRLAAGVVPGRIDFTDDEPRHVESGVLSMYSRASDRNAAATSVLAGRTLDVHA